MLVATHLLILGAREPLEQGAGPDAIARHSVGLDERKGEVQHGGLCMGRGLLQGGGDLALHAGG